MPRYEISGPDGARYEMTAPNDAAAADAVRQHFSSSRQSPAANTFQNSAGAPRIVEFEGRRHEFPGDATDDEIAEALSGYAPAQPEAGAEEGGFFENPARALQVGAQGVGRGVADLAGMPVDLATGAINLGLSGGELLAGIFSDEPVEFGRISDPVGGSNWIADTSSDLVEAIGGSTISPAEMSYPERFGYNVNRFGTEGLAGGAALARGAAARFVPGTPPKPGIGDALMRPYAGSPTRTVVGGHKCRCRCWRRSLVRAGERLRPDG